jgi:hypothetical protein
MSQLLKVTGSLAAVGMGLASYSVASATDGASSTYQLMSDSEIAAHTATMQVLQGAAREEYRDAQYERLKQRALEHGFLMPDVPPWRSQSKTAAAADQAGAASTSGPDAAVAAADRHAAMRNKLEARREAAQQAEAVEPEKVQTGGNAVPQTADAQTRVESPLSQPQTARMTAAGKSDGETPQASPTGAPQVSAIDDGKVDLTAEAEAEATNVSDAPSSKLGASDASSGNAAAEATGSRAAPTKAVTAIHAPTPPAPPEPPSPPPAYQPGSVSGLGVQAGPTRGAVPSAAAGMENASSDAMNAYRDAMRERFDEYMQQRQAQLDENMRRQREQHQAAMERNRTEAPIYPAQPYAYPPVPAYGPRYPAAFPGYRTPYWQQP